MTFTLLQSRHGIYYLRLILRCPAVPGRRRERRLSLRTKDKRVAVRRLKMRLIDMSNASRRSPDPELEAIARAGEAEALRQRDLYARGLRLMGIYGNVDQDKDPLGFDLLTDGFDDFDVEAYLFTQAYLANMEEDSGVDFVAQPATARSPARFADAQPPRAPIEKANARKDMQLSDLVSMYVASRPTVGQGSRISDRAKCMLFLRVVELEIQRPPKASDITNETMRAYGTRLHHMPTGIRVEVALTTARIEDASRGTMSPKTKFSHAQVVKQFIHWMDDNKYAVDRQVLTILKPHLKKSGDTKPRVSLQDEEVAALLKQASAGSKYAAEIWVPLLAAYTGARPGELCQLRCADIFEDPAFSRPMLRITDEAEGQQLKTDNSQREVPIHDHVLACGFLDFVECRRKTGTDRLFPEESRSVKGEFSAFSKRINRRMKALGIKGTPKSRKDFYSLRHTVIEKLKEAAVPEYVITSITGHASDDRPLAFTRYGMGGISAETKYVELSKLSYGSPPTWRWTP